MHKKESLRAGDTVTNITSDAGKVAGNRRETAWNGRGRKKGPLTTASGDEGPRLRLSRRQISIYQEVTEFIALFE